MSTSKRFGLLLIVILGISLLSYGVDLVRNLDLQKLLPTLQVNTRVETLEKLRVTEEESAVISVVEKASPAVVSVVEKSVVFDLFSGPRLAESSIGTGFAVEKDIVVTNKHVVATDSAEYTVVSDGQEESDEGQKYAVVKIYRDPLNDLALLKIENGDLPTLPLGDSDQIKVGQTAIAIGNALGRFSNTVTKGVISGIGRGITAQSGFFGQTEVLEDVIQTDAALNPGNSGGPLLNLAGEVIGVNVAIGQGSENIGFAIPVNRVKTLIENFKENKKISRPFLGISYQMVSEDIADLRGLVEGAFVQEVIEGSGADEAGVRPNDIITHIGEVRINEKNSLGREILKHQVGDEVVLKIWRNGKELELRAKLKEAPEG